MKPRLFVVMLLAFALVIVLGIGGMVGFFGLSVAVGMRQQAQDTQVASVDLAATEARYVRVLQDYYAERGSWDGVRQALRNSDLNAGPVILGYTVVDESGKIVASSQFGPPLPPPAPGAGTPIEVGGQRVGAFVVNVNRTTMSGIADWPSRVARGLLSGGLGLAAVLLALATFFSSRISTPLRRLTRATQAMAAGDMSVRVAGYRVREIDDLAQSFNAMADSLVLADQQRRQLTADVAHELRTPLSIIKGRLEGIQDGVYQPTPEQVSTLLGETALLERMIEDLRVLAMADAGQLPLYPEPMDPIDLLYDVADSFEVESNERGVAISVAAPDDLPELYADPQRIAQVLGNLVSNALRHTPAGGAITLAVEAPEDQVGLCFSVADTGSGIASDDLPHIFDRFWRADRARSRSSGGAGLGLAIVRRIVEAHKGTIWATSTIAQGTTITFTLPFEQPETHTESVKHAIGVR